MPRDCIAIAFIHANSCCHCFERVAPCVIGAYLRVGYAQRTHPSAYLRPHALSEALPRSAPNLSLHMSFCAVEQWPPLSSFDEIEKSLSYEVFVKRDSSGLTRFDLACGRCQPCEVGTVSLLN